MDTAKHLYDISVLFSHYKIQKLLNDKDELNELIDYKRQEEKVRIGGIDEKTAIKEFNTYCVFTEDKQNIDEADKSNSNFEFVKNYTKAPNNVFTLLGAFLSAIKKYI